MLYAKQTSIWKYLLSPESDPSLSNVVFSIKDMTVDNVQNCDSQQPRHTIMKLCVCVTCNNTAKFHTAQNYFWKRISFIGSSRFNFLKTFGRIRQFCTSNKKEGHPSVPGTRTERWFEIWSVKINDFWEQIIYISANRHSMPVVSSTVYSGGLVKYFSEFALYNALWWHSDVTALVVLL
jgi:hypothetical protein